MLEGEFDGQRVRSLRIERGLRQGEFAQMAGISAYYLRLIELHGQQPSPVVRKWIARALRVDVSRLLVRAKPSAGSDKAETPRSTETPTTGGRTAKDAA